MNLPTCSGKSNSAVRRYPRIWGRISGAPGSHLKEVKFLEDIMQTRVQSPIKPTWNQHVNPITSRKAGLTTTFGKLSRGNRDKPDYI
jgi:hypothetical protein